MNKELRQAVKEAESKLKEADAAIKNIERYITFYRFSRQAEPRVIAYNGVDIVLEYRWREIPIERVIEIMEDAGYITPDDFI